MPVNDDDHDGCHIERIRARGFQARCSCGWLSPMAVTARAAGMLWDEHRAPTADPAED